jgi:hypothetical protein
MVRGPERITLTNNINSAFSSANISDSATRFQRLSPRADFLAISRELGILGDMDEPAFRRYRRNLPFPRLIQQILTITHRAALSHTPPIPMNIEINVATPPSIEITVTDQLISIRLNRPDPPP